MNCTWKHEGVHLLNASAVVQRVHFVGVEKKPWRHLSTLASILFYNKE